MDINRFETVMIIENCNINRLIADHTMKNSNFSRKNIYCDSVDSAITYLSNIETSNSSKIDVPDLILLELHLPVLDGYEFLNQFACTTFSQKIPVFVLTASIHPEDQLRVKAYKCVKQYLSKPLTNAMLKQIELAARPETYS